MRDTRWLAASLVALGVALTTYGWLSAWAGSPGARDMDLELGFGVVTGWAWLIDALLAGGVGFAMLAGMRRSYLPPPFVIATLFGVAAAGLGLSTYALHRARLVDTIDVYDFDIHRSVVVPMKLTISPWLTLVGFAALVAGGVWLWRIAKLVRHRAATERARVDREVARRAGDIVPVDDAPVAEIPRL